MNRLSGSLALYLAFTAVADGWVRRKLDKRLAEGKEHPERMPERLGVASIERPDGALAWFHAASVGESLSLLELLRNVRGAYPDLSILVTTGTKTAASLLNVRLPEGVIHQFSPVDSKPSVDRFLAHWRPDVAVLTESEFWPRLMVSTKRSGAQMVLVNGRISDASVDRWRWFKGMSRRLMNLFDVMLVQDEAAAKNLRTLGAPGARITVTGSLKEGSVPLPDNAKARADVLKSIAQRPVWLAASTHEGEEEQVAQAHTLAVRRNPELLLILAPRHPERSGDVEGLLKDAGLDVAVRSKDEKITDTTSVYLADTLGEMGIWYRIAPLSFVGGSLVPIGGHNPFEPAALGSAIIHGPHVHNFEDIFARLAKGQAAIEVKNAEGLAEIVLEALRPDIMAELAAAAWAVSSEGAGVTDAVLDELRPIFDAAIAK